MPKLVSTRLQDEVHPSAARSEVMTLVLGASSLEPFLARLYAPQLLPDIVAAFLRQNVEVGILLK